jgi:hypothetical protein
MSKPVDEWAVITLTDGGSREMVFLRPLLVVPGILGPTMDDVYLIISVSGGRRTPPRILAGSLQCNNQGVKLFHPSTRYMNKTK